MEKKDYISAEEQLFRVPYEAMGQEVYTGEEVNGAETYSPKEMARLWSFEHTIRQADEVELRLKANTPQEMWWVTKDADGNEKKRNLLWRESQHMVDTMRHTAWLMYVGHDRVDPITGEESHVPGLIEEPKMKEAADQLLHQIHQEKEEAREFEITELDHLWEAK